MNGYTPIATFARPQKVVTDPRTGQQVNAGTDNRAPMQQVAGTGNQGLAWIRQGSAGAKMGAQLTTGAPPTADASQDYDASGIGYDHYHDQMKNYVGGADPQGNYRLPDGRTLNEAQFRKYTTDNWSAHGPQGQAAMVKKLAPIYGTRTAGLNSLSPPPANQGAGKPAADALKTQAEFMNRDRSLETGTKLLGTSGTTPSPAAPIQRPQAAAKPSAPAASTQPPASSIQNPASSIQPPQPRQLVSNDPALLKRLQAQGAPTVPPVNGQPSPGAPAPSPSRTTAFDALMNPATPSPFMQTVQAAIKKPTTTPATAPKKPIQLASPAPTENNTPEKQAGNERMAAGVMASAASIRNPRAAGSRSAISIPLPDPASIAKPAQKQTIFNGSPWEKQSPFAKPITRPARKPSSPIASN